MSDRYPFNEIFVVVINIGSELNILSFKGNICDRSSGGCLYPSIVIFKC